MDREGTMENKGKGSEVMTPLKEEGEASCNDGPKRRKGKKKIIHVWGRGAKRNGGGGERTSSSTLDEKRKRNGVLLHIGDHSNIYDYDPGHRSVSRDQSTNRNVRSFPSISYFQIHAVELYPRTVLFGRGGRCGWDLVVTILLYKRAYVLYSVIRQQASVSFSLFFKCTCSRPPRAPSRSFSLLITSSFFVGFFFFFLLLLGFYRVSAQCLSVTQVSS